MLSAEEIKQISEILENQLKPIKNDINEMKDDIIEIKDDINELKKHSEVTRYAANLAINWIDTYFREEYPLKELINKDK